MIYNIIVDSQPEPSGDFAQELTVEIEMDSNPEFVPTFGEGTVLGFRYPMAGDWTIERLDADVRKCLADEMEEKHLPPG